MSAKDHVIYFVRKWIDVSTKYQHLEHQTHQTRRMSNRKAGKISTGLIELQNLMTTILQELF